MEETIHIKGKEEKKHRWEDLNPRPPDPTTGSKLWIGWLDVGTALLVRKICVSSKEIPK